MRSVASVPRAPPHTAPVTHPVESARRRGQAPWGDPAVSAGNRVYGVRHIEACPPQSAARPTGADRGNRCPTQGESADRWGARTKASHVADDYGYWLCLKTGAKAQLLS